MAGNDKKFIVKNGLTTQNIAFVDHVSDANNTINVTMLNGDTLSFSGNSGQLFSITDSLTGTIFAVNDISGVPSIEVDDDGTVRFAETFGNVLIGTNTDDGVSKLQVDGNIAVTGTVDGRDIASDGSKLDGIETGAEANPSDLEILAAIKNVDGSGSGLDADTLDGNQASAFATAVQGTLADSAVQPGDDISTLTNDSGYISGNQTIILTGDVSGSGTTSISVTVADDSHNHVISNVDGLQAALNAKLDDNQKGAANGLAELDATGKVPAAQLPSYVDDVLEYAAEANFPATGETAKLYVALDTNDVYRWSGSAYIKVSDAVSTADTATKLATARDISLSGDVSGVASFDGSANITITTTVADDSHNHVISNIDGLQIALDDKANDSTTISAGPGLTGGGDLSANRTISHADTSSQGSVNNSNGTVIQDVTLDTYGHVTGLASIDLDQRYYDRDTSDNRYVNVTGDTMSGALTAPTLKITNAATNTSAHRVSVYDSGTTSYGMMLWNTNATSGDWSTMIYGPNQTGRRISFGKITGSQFSSHSDVSEIAYFDLDDSTLRLSADAFVGSNKVFHDGYHPNADKWTTARTLSLSGDASGSVNWDGSANATLSVTVADDSHNHVISNIDGLQNALDGKLSRAGGSMTGDFTVTSGDSNGIYIGSGGANITSVTPSAKDIVIQDVAQIRFGGASWDWNAWAGIAFNDTTEVLTIGGPSSGAFTSNASPPDITINFDGLAGTTGLKYEGSTIWHAGNDGTGSGLDADLLDGQQGSYYLNYNNFTNTPIIPAAYTNSDVDTHLNTSTATSGEVLSWNGTDYDWITVNSSNADTLDGIDSTQFLRSDVADTKTSGDLGFSDNVKAAFGASADLQIYHSGTHSYITDVGTGSLYIRGTNLVLSSAAGETYADFTADGAARLFHNGLSKLSTTSTGVDVTGNVDADTLSVGGSIFGNATNFTVESPAYFQSTINAYGTLFMSGNIDFQGTSGIIYLSDVPLIDLATDDSGKYVALRYDGTKVVETTSSGLYLNEFGATIRGLYGVDIGGYNNQVGLSAEYDDGTQNVFGTLQYSGATKIAASNTGVHVSGNITLGGTVDGRDVAADGEKLDGIEAAATRDQTASEILTAIKTVDGSGSGLDADLLDDQQGSYYLDYNNFTNTPAAYTNSSVDTHLNLSAAGQNYVLSWSGADYEWTQSITPSSTFTKTVGNVYFNDNVKLYFGTNGDLGIYHDGQNSYINDSGTGGLNLRTSAFTVSAPTGGPVIALDQYGAGSWYYEGSSRVTVNNLGVNIDGNRLYVTNDIEAGGSLRLDGTEAWSYDGSDGTIASPKTVKAPSFVGDGSNLTGISAGATGGGSDEVFWENDTRVTSNYTITNNKNAMSAGPITILSQITVTVGDGETWTIV